MSLRERWAFTCVYLVAIVCAGVSMFFPPASVPSVALSVFGFGLAVGAIVLASVRSEP